MSIVMTSMPVPARRALTRQGASKYDLGSLVPGSDQCIVETDVVVPKRVVSRLTSAVTAFRKRPGNENAVFAVRSFKNEEGNDCVGVWRLADKQPGEAGEAAAE